MTIVKEWSNEEELRALVARELSTPVVGGILDGMGYYRQFLPQGIQPLRAGMRVVGRAMPVLMMDVYGPQEDPFGLMTQALHNLRPGEVYIAAGAFPRSANWGEIMTAAAKARGVVVEPGDFIFGDVDEAVAGAVEKARGEKVVRKEIEAGMTATEAFRKYGILYKSKPICLDRWLKSKSGKGIRIGLG